jgi:hypothetical protein
LISLDELDGFLHGFYRTVHVFAENNDRMPFKNALVLAFFAFDDVQVKVTRPVFLDVKKISPSAVAVF